MTELVKIPNSTIYDKLVLIKLYEDKLKEMKSQLSADMPMNASMKTKAGKVTKSEASRVTIDGTGLFTILATKGLNPINYGPCSVKVSEKDLQVMLRDGDLTNEEVEQIIKETEYSMLRITPNKQSKELFAELTQSLAQTPTLLEEEGR